jgi:hypothetical protein
MMFNGGISDPDGSFSLSNVPPGEHSIDIAAQTRTPEAPPETASVALTVWNQDITNLRITTAPPATVSGTVVFEGSSPRTGVMGGLRVVARPTDPENPGAMTRFEELGRVEESGAFLLRGVGDVFFRPVDLGPWVLKHITLDGEDITDTPYQLRASQNIDGLRVVLTDRVTDVSGSVTGERSAPIKDFVVVIQPVRDLEGTTLQRFLHTARPDQDGRFRIRGMPPGDYVATAIEALEQGREWDPEYRPQLREAGRRFSLKEGATIDLNLTLASGL